MAHTIDHGYFFEFKQTPEEENTYNDRQRIKALESKVASLEYKLTMLYNEIDKMKGGSL